MTPTFEPVEKKPPKKSMTPVLIIVLVLVLGACLLGLPILAAILLPVFSQARDAATTAQALSNVKTQAIAASIYSADYDGRLPLASNVNESLAAYVEGPILDPKSKKPFAYNKDLSSVVLEDITNAENLIMFYNPSEGNGISYMYPGGKCPVAFADLKARNITPNTRVVWKPVLKKGP